MAVEAADDDRGLNDGGRIHGCFCAIQELIWTKGVLGEIGFDYVGPMILHMDSQNAMALARNPTHHKRSKHIDIKYHWLRKHTYESGTVDLTHCKTEDMVADVTTKTFGFEATRETSSEYFWVRRCLGGF